MVAPRASPHHSLTLNRARRQMQMPLPVTNSSLPLNLDFSCNLHLSSLSHDFVISQLSTFFELGSAWLPGLTCARSKAATPQCAAPHQLGPAQCASELCKGVHTHAPLTRTLHLRASRHADFALPLLIHSPPSHPPSQTLCSQRHTRPH